MQSELVSNDSTLPYDSSQLRLQIVDNSALADFNDVMQIVDSSREWSLLDAVDCGEDWNNEFGINTLNTIYDCRVCYEYGFADLPYLLYDLLHDKRSNGTMIPAAALVI